MSEDFVHLHLHSDMSKLDGLGKISEYVSVAKERGAPAIAFTDHGTMRGYLQQHEQCAKAEIKPIYGTEFYISPNMRRHGLSKDERKRLTDGLPKGEHKAAVQLHEEQIGLRDRWHITVWAHNQEGLRNLYRLTSAAWIEGFYYHPRIDLDELVSHSEGLMVATGCLASPIHEQWRSGKKRDALSFADRLYETFGDRMWLEVQPHAIEEQRKANSFIVKDLRERYKDVLLLATQDAHYVNRKDAPHHDCLLCIGTGKNLADTNRFRFDGDEFYFKSRKQMRKTFDRNHEFMSSQDVKEALDSTILFAERCSAVVEIDYKKALLPDPGIPKKYAGNAFQFLKDLCLDGWKWREVPKRAVAYAKEHGIKRSAAQKMYADRLLLELRELKRQRFESYFLMVRDIYREARERKIMVGPGRGSVGGSLIAYLLGFTAVDPLQHGLLFERFINPDRKDLPDIDMDFEDLRRGELIEYMRTKYGEDNVCQISTVNKLSGKQCFRDVSKVLGVPLIEVTKVTPSIIQRPKHDAREYNCIEDSFAEFEACKRFNEKYPDVLPHAMKLEGTAKTLGVHPAGVIASPVPLREIVPLEARKPSKGGNRVIVTAVDMEDAAKVGLVKLDFLGLRTLTVIRRCLEMIEKRHGEKIDLESPDFDIEDEETLTAFTEHDFVGVFQYDSASSDQICKGVEFERFEDIATMTALNRPGASKSGMDEKFRERKADPDLVKTHDFHKTVSKICGDTLGVFVYQEHAIKIFRAAGFSAGEADSLRKAIGKKLAKEEINKYREQFVNGAVKNIGMDEKVANRLMDTLVQSSAYLFNKSHATEYGLIGYWCVHGQTRLFDWDRGEYVTIASAHRNGVKRVACYDEKTGKTIAGDVKAIVKTGKKKVWRLRLQSFKTLLCSGEHQVLTSVGYKKVSELRVGDMVASEKRVSSATRIDVRSKIASSVKNYWDAAGAQEKKDRMKAARAVLTREDLVRNAKDSWLNATEEEKLQRTEAWMRAGGFKCVFRGTAKDGHEVFSFGELAVDDWLSSHGLEHKTQVPVGGGRRADFFCKGVYIEFDGMSRPTSYFRKKFGRRAYVVIKPKDSLDEVLQFLLEAKPIAAGASVTFEQVVLVEETNREVMMYDLSMERAPHNFLANNIVVHNCQWLKVHYPLEFFWACLVCEPDTSNITDYAREAKRRDIKVLPPHVNASKKEFSIDGEIIRGSLVDIKGVGDGAATDIMTKAPYKSFIDFIARIDRRKCNRGAVSALVRAGAFGDFINVKWMLGEGEGTKAALDELWKGVQKKNAKLDQLEAMVDKGNRLEDFDGEELALMQAEVSPVAFGAHPIDAYKSFIKREIKARVQTMQGETYYKDWDNKGHFVLGMIKTVKKHQVGDYGDVKPDEPFFGRPYANVNIEDRSGTERRVKFHHYVYENSSEAIDAGVGKPLLIHCTAFNEFSSIRGHFAVDVARLRKKLKTGEKLDIWEEIACGHHPARLHSWKDDKTKEERIQNLRFYKREEGGFFAGVVVFVYEYKDRRGNEMAYIGLLDAVGHYVRVVAFASVWGDIRRVVRPGAFLGMDVQRQPDKGHTWAYFFNGGRVKIYKKSTL